MQSACVELIHLHLVHNQAGLLRHLENTYIVRSRLVLLTCEFKVNLSYTRLLTAYGVEECLAERD